MSIFSRITGGVLTGGSLAMGNAKAMLVPETFGMPVVFSINPKSVDVTRHARSQGNNGTVNNPLAQSAKATSAVRLKLSDARLVGALTTRASVDTLLEWAEPKPTLSVAGLAGEAAGAASAAASTVSSLVGGAIPSPVLTRMPGFGGVSPNRLYGLPVLLFMWGIGGPAGVGAKVQLVELKATYTRFDWTGMPVMANVDLTLEMYEPELDGTNPSSGGVPGRSQHQLADGENVIGVATAKYGTPDAWRAVAAANGLDDPLRVRSGRVLHLPGPSELGT